MNEFSQRKQNDLNILSVNIVRKDDEQISLFEMKGNSLNSETYFFLALFIFPKNIFPSTYKYLISPNKSTIRLQSNRVTESKIIC